MGGEDAVFQCGDSLLQIQSLNGLTLGFDQGGKVLGLVRIDLPGGSHLDNLRHGGNGIFCGLNVGKGQPNGPISAGRKDSIHTNLESNGITLQGHVDGFLNQPLSLTVKECLRNY